MSEDFKHLRADRLIETADRLASRVTGRFAKSGLSKVSVAVADVTRNAIDTAEKINTPNWMLRIGLIALAVVIVVTAVIFVSLAPANSQMWEYARLTSGAAVWLGAVVVFFWTLETRFKRGKAVRAIHDLRAMAHIIDMHQLSKDPECGPDSDPAYNRDAMVQYLHYCSELLAMLSKVAQLYVEDFADGPTLAAVDQLENLTTGLSQKIWQKLMILEQIRATEAEEAEQAGS